MNILIAPVQGHTDAAWRHFHHKNYGGDSLYYTPFIRLEHGEFRKHDIKDFKSELNEDISLVPQVIFKDMSELTALLDGLVDLGASRIDLNSGCPFPLQTSRGRGAGFIRNSEEYKKLPEVLAKYPGVDFSLKMRLGYADPEEWKDVMPILNELKLTHITLHPRVARQQYGGEVDMNQFESFISLSRNPVVYNGDIRTLEDISRIETKYPQLSGIMLGRGLLGRPSLIAEHTTGEEMDKKERIRKTLKFHSDLLAYYQSTLCGDAQILSKIKPFWEYAEEEIGRKPWKAIKKASSMAKYHSAVASI